MAKETSRQKAYNAYLKNQKTKGGARKAREEAKKKKKKVKKTIGSSYDEVRNKTQTVGSQGKENRQNASVKKAALSVGNRIKNNVETSSQKVRSGAVKPVSSHYGNVEKKTQDKKFDKAAKAVFGSNRKGRGTVERKSGESRSDYLKRVANESKKYNANNVERKTTKTKTGYTDEDRQKISADVEGKLLKEYGKKYNRVKAFRDQWNEKGGLGDQFKEINNREATAEERKDYYKKFWKPDYEKQTQKLAKKQADEIAKEEAPDVLYSKELDRNTALALQEYSKYVGKGKDGESIANKALKGMGTLKYTLDDLGKTKADGTKVTKKDLGKVKLDKKGNIKYQQVAKRDYKGDVVRDKSGKVVYEDRNVAEEVGSAAVTEANKGKFAYGMLSGSGVVNPLKSGVGEYNNAAKKVRQNVEESGAYMGGYMAGFGAQFGASGVGKLGREIMEDAIARGVVEDAEGIAGKALNKLIGGAQRNAGIKFAENRGLDLAVEAPLNFADATKMSMDENGKVNTKALALYMTLNSGLSAGMGGAMEGVGVAFTRANSKRFADLYAKSLKGIATEPELKEMNALQKKLNKAGQDVAYAKSNISHKALYNKTVGKVVFDETGSADKAIKAMQGASEHSEKMEYAQAIRDKALADIDELRTERIKLLDEANSAPPNEAIALRAQASAMQSEMDSLSNIARGADSQFQVSAKVNRRALNELKIDLQRMSYKTGVNYRVVDSSMMESIMREAGDAPKAGHFYRGFFYKNADGKLEVLINSESPQAHQIVVGHEIGHMIKDSSPAEFDELGAAIREYAEKLDSDAYKELEQDIRDSYSSLGRSEEAIQEELTCELVGRYIVGADKDFIKQMAGDNPSIFKKILDYIKQLFDNTTSKELKQSYKKLYETMSDLAQKIDTEKVNAVQLRESQTKKKAVNLRETEFKDIKDITPETVVAPNGVVRKEADTAYADAVKRKDWKRAQAFVDAVLEAKGYDIKALHGTETFGFTTFDFKAMEGIDKNNSLFDATMIFTTDSKKVAASYVRRGKNPPIKDVKDANKRATNEYKIIEDDISDTLIMWDDAIMGTDVNALAHGEKVEDYWFLGETKDGTEKYGLTMTVTKDSCELKIQDYDTFDYVYKFSAKRDKDVDVFDWRTEATTKIKNALRDAWASEAMGRVPAEPNIGIYNARLKMENPLVIDCKNGNWMYVPFPYNKLTAKEKKWLEKLENEVYGGIAFPMDGENILLRTRIIGQLAANRKYDGVRFLNISDIGAGVNKVAKGEDISDVSIIFNSNQFKVADVATYDKHNKLIPLSERANETNPDIRFSQELTNEKPKAENIRLRETEGEIQGRQIQSEPNREVGEKEGRGLEEGGRSAEGVRVVSDSVRKKMDRAGIGNSGLREASHEEFSKALDEARKANPRGDYVDGKSIEELKEHGAKCILTDDGRAGVCIEKDGNISGLFRHPDSTHKGVLRELVLAARENGGTKMDCFGEYLADAYEQCGFVKVNKIENNPKFSDIKDDVYALMVTPESTNEVLYRIALGNFSESPADIPYYSIKEYGDDAYGEALKARDKQLDWQTKYRMNENQIRALDEDYMKAIKETEKGFSMDSIGAREEAQEIVDRVASSRLDTKARNQDGSLIMLNHSTMTGKFNEFDMDRANPSGDSGAGIYTSSSARDAEANYSTSQGGDNEARIQRRADEILADADDEGRELTYDEAFEEARQELEVGAENYHFYGETKNPVYVGAYRDADGNVIAAETDLMDDIYRDIGGKYDEWEEGQFDTSRWDYDTEEEFLDALNDEWTLEFETRVNEIAYKVEDIAENWEEARDAVEHMFYDKMLSDETLTFDEIKSYLYDNAYLYDWEGRNVVPEIARAITEELGHDSVWDNTVARKWGWWSGLKEGDFHIIFFHPNQVKLAEAITRDSKGNIIPPSERFNRYENEFRFSQTKKKKVEISKLDSLNDELKNYETALKNAATKEEKSLIKDAIADVKSKIERFEKSDAPKEPPKKVSKAQAKAKIKSMSESQKVRKEFNKYRDKSKKWADYKEISELEQERWNLMEEMGYKRGNKKQEARLEEIHNRLTELGRYDDDFAEKKATVKNELWQTFHNKRNRKAAREEAAENKAVRTEMKDVQHQVEKLTAEINDLEAKLRRMRSEENIQATKKTIRGKKAARTRLENKMKSGVEAISESANKQANRAIVAGKNLSKETKKKSKPAKPKVAEPASGKVPVGDLVDPNISKNEKELKQKALKDGNDDANLTVRKELEYIKENYGSESELFKVLQDGINNGHFNKKKDITYAEAKEKAASEIAEMGYEEAKNLFLRTNPLSDPALAVHRAEALRQEIGKMLKAGDGDAAKLAADEKLIWQPLSEMSNLSGRAQRAIREIRMLTPEGRKQVVLGEIERLQKKYAKNLKGKEIEVDPKKIERLADLEAGEERDALLQEINMDIWEQIPASLFEKMNEIRHCFMLFNARTHGRNIFGNMVFAMLRKASDEMEVAILNSRPVKQKIEAMGGDVDKVHVTRAEKAELKDFAETEFDIVYKDSGSRNKFIELGRPEGVPTINWKPMQKVIDKNYEFLEKEDLKFTLIPEFRKSYIGWCKSRYLHAIEKGKIDPKKMTLKQYVEGMSNAQKNKARHFALAQGEYATFRDACALSTWLTGKKQLLAGMKADTKMGTLGYRALDTVLEGALPFVKTPINIFRRSMDYSPYALLRAWGELHKAPNATVFKQGVHDLCTGLTGTGVMGIGFFMATQDWLTIKAGSDRQGSGDAFADRDMGFQDYSIKIKPPFFNKEGKTWSWTLDWASPTEMSLFAGAALWEQFLAGKEKYKEEGLSAFFSTQEALNTFFAITSPLTDTSFMSSSKDTMQRFLERATRSTDEKETDFSGAMAQLITGDLPKNYVSGFEPQLMAQIAGFLDPVQRDTRSTAKSEFVKGWDSAFKQLVSRVPVARTMLNPKLDRYGVDKINEDSTFARFCEAMILPMNVKQINMNERDQKLISIRNSIEDKSSDEYRYFWFAMTGNPTMDLANGKRMTYRELYDYGKKCRRFQTKMFDDMFDAKSYKNMTDKMRVDEVDECNFIAQNYADWKVYGANYATKALASRGESGEREAEKIKAYRNLKGVGAKDEKANETYMKYYIRKERYINRSHADTTDGYYLKALSAQMTGDKALVSALDLDDSKVQAAKKYMSIMDRKANGNKKLRNERMFQELTDGSCNIISNLEAEGIKSTTKGLKSVSAGLCAVNENKVPERVYRFFGHNWNSAQSGGGLMLKYNTDGRYDLENINNMKTELKSLGDINGDGKKKNKKDVMAYIESKVDVNKNPDEAACLFEVLYSQGRYKNPYKSQIDDHLEWGNNRDDWWGTDTGGSGGYGRRGRGHGHRGGGGGRGGKADMPKTASGAISGKVTNPFSTSNGSKDSNLNDAYRKKARKLREQSYKH